MQLLPCNRPSGLLESAPKTSLRTDSAHEQWEGFWCVADEHYYTRCVRADGAELWFRMVDEAPRDDVAHWIAPRIIKFSSTSRTPSATVGMRLLPAGGRRPILVGKSRRRGKNRVPAGSVS